MSPSQDGCCELHGRNCEPSSELCCRECTERHHGGWTDSLGRKRYGHLAYERCSNPDLSGTTLITGRQYPGESLQPPRVRYPSGYERPATPDEISAFRRR